MTLSEYKLMMMETSQSSDKSQSREKSQTKDKSKIGARSQSRDKLQPRDKSQSRDKSESRDKSKTNEKTSNKLKETPSRRGSEEKSESRVYSDDIQEMCLVKCRICHKIYLRYLMYGHIKKYHPEMDGKYGSYGYYKKTYTR